VLLLELEREKRVELHVFNLFGTDLVGVFGQNQMGLCFYFLIPLILV